ncbi:MAG TPA: hypothetical protein EYQ26_09700 [Rhodospirillales bacterium]|nr:hypothetical protein [Rhodospirillales bacterium]HIL75511.1 hypothetical protein [Rhodospirillales bacterium]
MDDGNFKKGHNYIDPLWNLADTITVVQAAALIAGFEPNSIRFNFIGEVYFEDECGVTDNTDGRSVKTAYEVLKNAIYSGKLQAKIIHDSRLEGEEGTQKYADMTECGEYFNVSYEHVALEGEHFSNGYFVKNNPDWNISFLAVEDLQKWLSNNGFRTGFFFPGFSDAPDYLDIQNPRYAPKLAAAVKAWQAVINPKGKTPKQAIIKWLREHAADYGLSDDEGKPNETGIEEVAKVANWKPGGGAPKMPNR